MECDSVPLDSEGVNEDWDEDQAQAKKGGKFVTFCHQLGTQISGAARHKEEALRTGAKLEDLAS